MTSHGISQFERGTKGVEEKKKFDLEEKLARW